MDRTTAAGAVRDSAVERRRPLLSVIIPTLDEEAALGGVLSDLESLTVSREVIVADGGSSDLTPDVARAAGGRVVTSGRGRGLQLRAGAAVAQAPMLLFLHADARLDGEAIALLDEIAIARPPCAMAFRLRIDARGFAYRLIEWGTNLRTRLAKLPYGDQGLVVRREDYARAGGYPDLPLMEDVALVRSLRRITPVHLLDAAVTVSPRRWRREGPLRRMLRNWILLVRFLAGTPAEKLAEHYRPEPAVHD
jgi:rSAM/selenodomain-associated transferase 2